MASLSINECKGKRKLSPAHLTQAVSIPKRRIKEVSTDGFSKIVPSPILFTGSLTSFANYPIVLNCLEVTGMGSVLNFTNNCVYPILVKEFYANLMFQKDENDEPTFSTRVKGMNLFFNKEIICLCLNLPLACLKSTAFKMIEYPSIPLFETFMKVLCVKDFTKSFSAPPKFLEFQNFNSNARFLAKLVRENLFPCVKYAERFYFKELYLMYITLTSCELLDIPSLVISCLDLYSGQNVCAFGLLITRLIIGCGIEMGNDPCEVVSSVIAENSSVFVGRGKETMMDCPVDLNSVWFMMFQRLENMEKRISSQLIALEEKIKKLEEKRNEPRNNYMFSSMFEHDPSLFSSLAASELHNMSNFQHVDSENGICVDDILPPLPDVSLNMMNDDVYAQCFPPISSAPAPPA